MKTEGGGMENGEGKWKGHTGTYFSTLVNRWCWFFAKVVYADGGKSAAAKKPAASETAEPAAAADEESEGEDVDIDAIWDILRVRLWHANMKSFNCIDDCIVAIGMRWNICTVSGCWQNSE